MSEKKTFFASLQPRSALLVGAVAGILAICTIGFIIMGVIYLRGDSDDAGSNTSTSTATATNIVDQQQPVAVEVTKTDKPKVELFIMSYCPYGLQMQKAFLPVMELLKSKADMDVKWVSYIMHGKKEIDENDRQYCIQKEQNDKYLAYATCFTGKDDYSACLKTAQIDESKMNACIKATDSQYKTTEKYNDKSTWLSGNYPVYLVHGEANTNYQVGGSPTLVINGTQVQVSRTPEAVKSAVCSSFTTTPDECAKTLSTSAAVPGFGTEVGTDTAGVDCEG
ncbi:MAG: hypothetical protein ABIH87_03505 [bacterium]